MPEEIGYRRQVAPRAAEPMPLSSPASFGAQLGAAVEAAGQQAHEQAIATYRADRRHSAQEEWAGFQRAYVQARETMATTTREARNNGGAGHADAMQQAWETFRPALIDGLNDDDVRRRAIAAFETYGGDLVIREGEFEEVQRIGNLLADWADYEQLAVNGVRRAEDHDRYLQEIEAGYQALEGMNLPADQERQARTGFDRQLAIGFLRGRIEEDPQLAKAMMEEGLFDDTLEPGDVTSLLNSSDVEIRALEVQARREAAEQRAQVIEGARAAISRQGNGNPLPDEDWAQIAAAVAETGDETLIEDVTQARAESAFVRTYEGANPATPQELQERIRTLAGMGNRNDYQNRELAWLQRKLPSVNSQFERDPAGFLLQSGGAPELDIQDPTSWAERVSWSRAQTIATGRFVPPVSEADVAPLQDLLEQGHETQLFAVLDSIEDPLARVDVAQVIDPDNRFLHQMAVMRPRVRARMRRGREALRGDPQLLTPQIASGETAERLAAAEQNLRQALVEIDQADVEAMVEASQYYLAGIVASTGRSIDDQNGQTINSAFQVALGREVIVGRDGTRTRQGGHGLWGGEHAFVIPSGMTSQDWLNSMLTDYRSQVAAGTGPVNPDGSAISPTDLNRAYPVWLGGNFYRWETARGRSLYNEQNDLFITEIAR